MARKMKMPRMPKLSVPKSMNSLVKNKYVLYLILIVAIINLVGFFNQTDYTSIILFLVVGFFANCFTKNMTYVLLAPIIVVNLLVKSNFYSKIFAAEGLTNKKGMQKRHGGMASGLEGVQNQQQQLMENITSLGPILKDATQLLKNVDMGKMNKMMGEISQQGGIKQLINNKK